jgi:hypothetical protein
VKAAIHIIEVLTPPTKGLKPIFGFFNLFSLCFFEGGGVVAGMGESAASARASVVLRWRSTSPGHTASACQGLHVCTCSVFFAVK